MPDAATLAGVLVRVSDAVLTTDRDGGVEYLNEAAEQLFGVRLADVVGRPAVEVFVHPDARRAAVRWARRVIGGERVSERLARLVRADGSVFDGELSIFPIPDPRGSRVRAGIVVRDVTARLAAERRAATLQAVVDAAAEAIIGIEDGVITFFSPAAERMYGWREAEIVGRPPTVLVPEDHRADIAAIADEVRKGHSVRGETTGLRRDGSRFEAHLTASPFQGTDGRTAGAALIVMDLSTHRRAEREARRSRELLQRIVDHAPNVIVFKDVEGRCRLINERGARELFGCAPEEVVGRTDDELYPPAVAAELRTQDRKVIADGRPLTFEHELPTAGGRRVYLTTRFPIEGPNGEPDGVGAMKVDVTESRRAREAEARLAALVLSAPDAIVTLDREGVVTTWNPSATEMFGRSAEDAVGRRYVDITVPAAERPRFVRDPGEGPRTYRSARMRADGSVFPAQISVAPLTAEDGTSIGSLGVIRDITGLVEAERELRERAEQLERSNADLERFAYAASHDLQEPLRAMKLAADAVATAAVKRLNEDEKALLGQLDADAERLSAQIGSLMNGARVALGALQEEPVPLEIAVNDALAALRAGAQAAGAEIDVRRPLPAACVPRPVVSLVMQNLIANAIKYRRPGVPPHVRVSGDCIDSHVEVRVEDNGVGLAPEDRERIFEVFARAHSEVPGTGMGLAIVRRMLERHGGTIAASSPGPGRGSRFTVRLPS